jgi:hypothetical protein
MTSINKGERSSFNFYRVLRSIWLNQDISQVELGQEHSLDKATVSNIISYLSQKNIIKVVKKQQIGNKPGRRPVGLAINNNFGYIIGIEILNKGLKIVAVDMHNNKIVENYQNISITYGNMDILLSEGIEKFKKNSELEDKTCVSIGFGLIMGMVLPIDLLNSEIQKSSMILKKRFSQNSLYPALLITTPIAAPGVFSQNTEVKVIKISCLYILISEPGQIKRKHSAIWEWDWGLP